MEVVGADACSEDAVRDCAAGCYAGGGGGVDAADAAAAADGRFGGDNVGCLSGQQRGAKRLAAAALLLQNLNEL